MAWKTPCVVDHITFKLIFFSRAKNLFCIALQKTILAFTLRSCKNRNTEILLKSRGNFFFLLDQNGHYLRRSVNTQKFHRSYIGLDTVTITE